MHHSPVAPVTAAEQADLRLVVKLAKWAVGAGLLAAFAFGLWVATLQAQAAKIPLLEAAIEDLRESNRDIRNTLHDFMLLQCSDPTVLTRTDQATCAPYRVRIR